MLSHERFYLAAQMRGLDKTVRLRAIIRFFIFSRLLLCGVRQRTSEWKFGFPS